jgi:hypothetical protein
VKLAAVLVALALAPVAAAPGKVVRVDHREPSIAPSRGPRTAPVTLELFFVPTYAATTRVRMYRALENLQAEHPTRIRLVYRVMLQNETMIPTAALEAQAQGKFTEFLDAIAAIRERPTRDKLFDVWKRLGLDASRLDYALSEHKPYQPVLDENGNRFERLHGGNPPNVFINSRPPRDSNSRPTTLAAVSIGDLTEQYKAAYQDALDKLDQGISVEDLPAVFDREALVTTQPIVVFSGPTDDDDSGPREPPLAKPPLELRGLPSMGHEDAGVPIVVLCSPTNAACRGQLEAAAHMQQLYPNDVRAVWAPWFDVAREDSADLAMLADAALCAETVGSGPDLAQSAGWRWVIESYKQISQNRGRRGPADAQIDVVATRAEVDSRRLATCRARIAGRSLEWIGAARRAGVRTSPAIVIGGRIYTGLNDRGVLQQLVEAELAPGVLGSWPTWQ